MQSSVYDQSDDDNAKSSPSIYNMDVNYAVSNKWFAHYALEDVLGKGYHDLNLHLTNFSIP